MVAIESSYENQWVAKLGHVGPKISYNDYLAIGGKWTYDAGTSSYQPIWVANNETMMYKNFESGQGNSGLLGGQYLYMMPQSYEGSWGDYDGGKSAFVCESCKYTLN